MKSTKKECRKALINLEYSILEYLTDVYALEKGDIKNSLDILDKLIHEHFDNPPLKLEDIKPNMWVWDNEEKRYLQIIRIVDEENEIDELCFNYSLDKRSNMSNSIPLDLMWENERFYRKEIKNE